MGGNRAAKDGEQRQEGRVWRRKWEQWRDFQRTEEKKKHNGSLNLKTRM